MATILELVADHPTRSFSPGDAIMEQDSPSGPLFVLVAGEVEILRDDVRVAKTSQPGAVFGEMSVLLGSAHTATVRALQPCRFAVIEDPRQFLNGSAEASFQVASLLAKRLDALNKYLVDVKQQYEGHDHLGMVDEVLETLMHRQPLPAAR
jgi:CRP/FNR family cyclic AMP-dependent transcriptional regulator